VKPIRSIVFGFLFGVLGLALVPTVSAMDHAHHESASAGIDVAPLVASALVVEKDCNGGHCPDCFVMNPMAMCSLCSVENGDERNDAVIPTGFKQHHVAQSLRVIVPRFSDPPPRMGTLQKTPIPLPHSGSTNLRL